MFRKRGIYILLVIAIVLGYSLFVKHKDYKERKYLYATGLKAYLIKLHYDFVKETGKNNFTKEELENYMSSHEDVPYNVVDWLHKIDYGITYKYESILIYSKGFDNDDDKGEKIYKSDTISFMNSLFVNGDALLYEGFADIYRHEKNNGN